MNQANDAVTAVIGECRYHGDVANGRFTLDLDMTSCSSVERGLVCPDGITSRDARTRAHGLSGTVAGKSASGTSTETIDVLAAGADNPLGALIVEGAFTIRKQ